MANKIKAVLIDIDNTLLDFNKCAEKAIKMAFEKRNYKQPSDFFSVFKRNNDILWKKIERREMTVDDLIETRFNIIFKEAKIELDGREFELDFRKNLFHCAEHVNGAFDLLNYLSDKYLLFAASNGLQKQQENRLEIAGFSRFFKDVFTSERMGESKPNYQFFEGCLKAIGNLEKSEIIIIGESLTADVQGGNDFGIPSCWFNYQNEENLSGVEPNYVVYSLEQIKDILC